jgi:hypothetical protein
MKLKARHFDTTQVTEAESQAVLNTLAEHDFQDAFNKWPKCWERCMMIVMVARRSKVGFRPDGSTSPGNYGCFFVFYCLKKSYFGYHNNNYETHDHIYCNYQRYTYREGIMVILLVFLTGVFSLLAAPEGLLLLLELSAATLLLVDVEFLRGTVFRSGFTGTASCASGAAKVRLSIQTGGSSHLKMYCPLLLFQGHSEGNAIR